ncbi:MAG: aspartate-semialdehyde dehydrogenase [bacterium]|nr:aspartate-semialdehyde dehydrogenase [bacterium]
MNPNKEKISIEIDNSKAKSKNKIVASRNFNVAVVGATGLVGKEVIALLSERRFKIGTLKAFSSERTAGETIDYRDTEVSAEEIKENSFDDVDIAFFAVDNELAKKYCAMASAKGVICIDKSSAFREDLAIPLVVPEVNPEDIANYKNKNIISSPNCATIPLVQVLAPLNQKAKIKRVVVSTYQAVSGAGKNGIAELDKQTRDLFNMRDIESTVFANRIAFNVLPCIPATGNSRQDQSTDEEHKIIIESQRILNNPKLGVAVTCVRVPVFNGHSASVNIEFNESISPEEARSLLAAASGVVVIDDLPANLYPTPADASGEDVTLVGRIRKDESLPHGLSLWFSSDNLRTGAALNAVRIAEILCSEYLK